jgi:hypothetical protein
MSVICKHILLYECTVKHLHIYICHFIRYILKSLHNRHLLVERSVTCLCILCPDKFLEMNRSWHIYLSIYMCVYIYCIYIIRGQWNADRYLLSGCFVSYHFAPERLITGRYVREQRVVTWACLCWEGGTSRARSSSRRNFVIGWLICQNSILNLVLWQFPDLDFSTYSLTTPPPPISLPKVWEIYRVCS